MLYWREEIEAEADSAGEDRVRHPGLSGTTSDAEDCPVDPSHSALASNMFSHQDEVRRAIQHPTEAYWQVRNGQTSIVYWLETEIWPDNRYLRVVVLVTDIQGGIEQCDVRTAYPDNRIERRGKKL